MISPIRPTTRGSTCPKSVLLALPIAAALLAFPLLVRAPQATIVRVDPAAILDGDGASWDSASNDLQIALERSPSGSVFWCAKGNYKKIRIVKPCEIYGGFDGNEASLEERDWAANRSVFSSVEISSDALIDGVTFAFPPEGGEVSFNNADNPTLKNCRFSKTVSAGPAILSDGCSSPSLINCALIDCRAGASRPSPLILFRSCRNALILNCTVANSKLSQAGSPAIGFRDSTGEVHNSILWNPGYAEIDLDHSSAVKVSFSDVEGGYPGVGNVRRDPLLSGEYHLQPLSPCRDTASARTAPEEDLDGDFRPFGPGSDIGADECLLPYFPSGTLPFLTPPPRKTWQREIPSLRLEGETTPSPTAQPPTPSPEPSPSPIPIPSPTVPLLDEGFDDFHNGRRPAGWAFTNCNADSDTYTTASNAGRNIPSLKLDATGDSVTTAAFAEPNSLTFWVKGLGIDGTSSLLVEEYHSSDWHELTNLSGLPTTETTEGPFSLNPASIRLRFIYTKSVGNLAFDDVVVSVPPTPSPSPSPSTSLTPPTPTPSPSPELTASPTPIASATPSPAPTSSPSPTATAMPSATPTVSPTPDAAIGLENPGFETGYFEPWQRGDSCPNNQILRLGI